MKCWFGLVLCIGTAFAASIDVYNLGGAGAKKSIYDLHYEQHSHSVDAGRRSVAHRLGSSSVSSGYTDCGACLQQQTTAFDAESLDTGLGHGVGVVGLSGGSSGLSSSSLTSSSTQQLQPLYINPSTGLSSSSLTASHQISSGQPVGVYIPVGGGGGSENYQRHYEKHVSSNAAPIVVAPSGGSESYQRHYEKRIQSNAAPIVVAPSGGASERYQQHIEKRIQSNAAPVMLAPSGGSESFQRLEKRVQSTAAIPIVVQPSGGSESFHQSQRIVKTSAAAPVYIPQTGGSESFRQESQRIVSSNSAAPVLINPIGGSEFSSQYSQNLLRNQQAVPVSIYTPSGSSSSYTHEAQHSSNALTGGAVIPVSTGGSSSFLESSNRQSTSGSLIAPHYSTVGLGNSHLSTDFGSSQLSNGHGVGQLSTSSDLDYYMTESERLAKLQSQSVNQGGVRAGSSVLDTGLSSRGNLGTGGGQGNYRSQSWEKSSKWASGTELGHDGRPKNYNLLSTAEAEQHNLNGKHAGYKAATTTLDDDGKVSTYTLHTP